MTQKRFWLILITCGFMLIGISPNVLAQMPQSTNKPRKQFITFYIQRSQISPLHFKELTLDKLAGTELPFNYESGPDRYRSEDGSITVTGTRFSGNTKGVGVMLYPFGVSNNTTLVVKAGYETLPDIRFRLNFPDKQESYELINGRSRDFGLGVTSGGRNQGWWGMGARSFLIIGKGWITEQHGNGSRYFVEAGGGISFGVIGVDIVFGVNENRILKPRPYKFYTVPMGLRATLSF